MNTTPLETCQGCGKEINPWLDHFCKGFPSEPPYGKPAGYSLSVYSGDVLGLDNE